jgi:TM2 domain-containing membrane protein YozV
MYKIIGADQREYGPVDANQIRQWLTEGRVNLHTLIRPEGATEWKPLASFPELGGGTPPAMVPPRIPAQLDDRKSKLAAGLFGIFLGGLGVHRFYLGYTGIGIAQIAVTIATCGFGYLWGFIEGILILCGSMITTDSSGRTLKD